MKSALGGLAALLVSCGSGALSTEACPTEGTALTYESFGANFMSAYCVSCHTVARAEGGVDLSSLTNTRMVAAAVVSEAGTSNKMPPAGSPAPSAADRAKLVEWLSCASQ